MRRFRRTHSCEGEEPTAVRELREEVERLKVELLWKLNCYQLAEMDSSLLQKEEEIGSLRAEVAQLHGTSPVSRMPLEDTESVVEEYGTTCRDQLHGMHRGKAPPPVETFSGEDAENRFDDWLPTLRRTADWNGWTTEGMLIQLAGHMKGRALQEWKSIPTTEKNSYNWAVATLRNRLEPVNKIMAGQDFRHASLEESGRVRDFICRLERLFEVAYGYDPMSLES